MTNLNFCRNAIYGHGKEPEIKENAEETVITAPTVEAQIVSH
jgi:hypothetical protein